MSLTPNEQTERSSLIARGHTARTSARLDDLNRRLNGSKSNQQLVSEYHARAAAGKPVGQIAATLLSRGVRF